MIEVAVTVRLGRDAELRMVKGGELPMASFSGAVEERQQAADADTVWVRVVIFGERAEELAEALKAGVRCYVEGRLKAPSIYQAKSGESRVSLEIIASLVQPLGQIGKRRPKAPTAAGRSWQAKRSGPGASAPTPTSARYAAAVVAANAPGPLGPEPPPFDDPIDL